MPYMVKHQQSPTTWSTEGQQSMLGFHSALDASIAPDGGPSSQGSEPWTDAQTELPIALMKINTARPTQSVPPSPVYRTAPKHDRSKNKTSLRTNASRGNRRSASFSAYTHHRGDHSDNSKLSGSTTTRCHSSKTSSSSPCSALRFQYPHAVDCSPCGETESSQCSCSSLSSTQSVVEKPFDLRPIPSSTVRKMSKSRRNGMTEPRPLSMTDAALVRVIEKSASIGGNCQTDLHEEDFSSTVAWPTPVPIRSAPLCPLSISALDTINVFKYRVHYPKLLLWTQECMQSYAQQRLERGHKLNNPAQHEPLSRTDSAHQFMREVLDKQTQKVQEHKLNPRRIHTYDLGNFESHRSHLWKRRFYSLLDAVDLVYKDYQILHYVSRDALFHHVSNPPSVPRVLFSKRTPLNRRGWWSTCLTMDPQSLAAMSVDPVGQLSERVTQLIVNMRIHDMNAEQLQSRWPCTFAMSVAFLSDVMAQSRIVRCEYERREAVHHRLLYVLGQAREQRSKLKLHMLKQRELIVTLTIKYSAIKQRLLAPSPGQDQPLSIDQSLVNNIDSPFIDCDAADNDLTDQMIDIDDRQEEEQVSLELRNQSPGTKLCESIQKYRERREELQAKIIALERVLKEEETRRKRLHNRIQEITGNIRVFCRLRPRDTELTEDRGNSLEESRKSYLRVISDDKLLFCSDTLKEQAPGQVRAAWGTSSSTSSIALRSVYPRSSATISTNLTNGNCPLTPPKCFIFDRVFGPQATQTDVYDEVDDLIISCMDGYNVCIMAYGQTGSGKTYTMMGTPNNPGVNRRAIRSLFERCAKRKQWKFSIAMSMVEIYQEDVFDLLEERKPKSDSNGTDTPHFPSHPKPTPIIDRRKVLISRGSGSNKWKPQPIPWNTWTGRSNNTIERGFTSGRPVRRRGSVKIMSDRLDGIVLQNLTERLVHNEQEMCTYLERAEKQRRVGFTKLNICSSRSHLIIMLKVVGENQLHMTTSSGSLTLADLAGSENVNKSGSTGERFMEAACINKSLSSLGRVFDALRRQQKPTYRETKLTYLLRPNLGGESKVLLFVALRSEPEHAEETWRAVNFGQGAIQVIPGGGMTEAQKTRATSENCIHNSDALSTRHMCSPALPLFHCASVKRRPQRSNQLGHSFRGTSCLPQAVYSMGPAITKRSWK